MLSSKFSTEIFLFINFTKIQPHSNKPSRWSETTGSGMAGDPILYANHCAFVIADEPCRQLLHNDEALANIGKILELAALIEAPHFDMRDLVQPNQAFAIDDDLMREIGSLNRSSLVIVGGRLEGVVTQLSMSALLDGFDVFIPADFVLSGDPSGVAMYLDRVRAVSGIVLTGHQLFLELLLRERNADLRSSISSLRKQFSFGS